MIIDNLKIAFKEHFGDTENICLVRAPGRVNLIGEHTDYNDGFVLPMTIDRAVYFAMRKRDDDICNVYSLNFKELAKWSLNNLQRADHHWSNYIKGVMYVLQSTGYKFSGIDAVVYGDVPIGSGLSSSAAFEIATAYGLEHLYKLDIDAVKMIRLAQQAENNFVGVNCGIMDQFVSRLGKKDHALFIDCRTLDYKNVPLHLHDYRILIVDTKVKRELAKSAYNERRSQCEVVVEYFKKTNPQIKALRDVSLELLEQHAQHLPGLVVQRARHVITENQRVLDTITALEKNDLLKVGELFYASHASLKNDYAVSCDELDFIVDHARDSGSLGARLTGAGFGGAAVILAHQDLVAEISNSITDNYMQQFSFAPTVMVLTDNLETAILR